MNIRKWLCRNFGKWDWLYRPCNCDRYEPTPPPVGYVQRLLCSVTGLLANKYCPTVEIGRFIEGTEPTDKCTRHKEEVNE